MALPVTAPAEKNHRPGAPALPAPASPASRARPDNWQTGIVDPGGPVQSCGPAEPAVPSGGIVGNLERATGEDIASLMR